jgi:hypothetical protein
MTNEDQRTLKRFDALAARLKKLEARKRVGYRELMQTTRVHEALAALRAGASSTLRRQMRKQGWR